MNSEYRNASFALLAGAVLFSTGAWSMPPADIITRTETVKYDPREAATPEGAAALYTRLQKAADRVCSEPAGTRRPLSSVAPYAACVKAALGEAVSALHVPMVSVIHQEGISHQDAALARR
jgi:UrcA family protein